MMQARCKLGLCFSWRSSAASGTRASEFAVIRGSIRIARVPRMPFRSRVVPTGFSSAVGF